MGDMVLFMLIWAVGVCVLLYFMTILPNKKKNKKVREMHDSVAPGDQVITIGGVLGTVLERSGDEVRILTDEESNTIVWVLIYAIQSIRSKAVEPGENS